MNTSGVFTSQLKSVLVTDMLYVTDYEYGFNYNFLKKFLKKVCGNRTNFQQNKHVKYLIMTISLKMKDFN